MKYRFEVLNEVGDVVQHADVTIATSWEDPNLKLRHWMDFAQVCSAWETKQRMNSTTWDAAELEAEANLFELDMISKLAGVDASYVERWNAAQLAEFRENFKFFNTAPPKTTKSWFEFQTATDEEIKEFEDSIDGMKKHERDAAKKKLAKMKSTKFVIKKDMKKVQVRQFINSRIAVRKRQKIQGEFNLFQFHNMHRFLSYICVPEGERYNEEKAEKYAKLFLELPFFEAIQLTNFFLGWQIILQKNLSGLSQVQAVGKVMARKRKQSKSI